MFARFFIDRPVFATVLSLVFTLAGSLAIWTLPVAQYPDIAPPTVEVSVVYPGANAQVVADTVAAPIEQQVNGVEGMLYMSSQCTNDGTYTLTVSFQLGVDLNMAQVLVQNRVALAEPVLPDLVRRRGVVVKKKSPTVLMIVNLFSPDTSRDNLYLSNYATIQIRDELARLPGVGDITYLGQRDYSMRVWLDPEKMSARGLAADDVVRAVGQQNVQVAAGQLGQPPVGAGQVFQYAMTTLGRLVDVEQFSQMILKADTDGRVVRLQDVSRVELGAQVYDQSCTLDGRPSVALSVYQLPGSNALKTARLVRAKMEELQARFPAGVDYAIAYDTTPFIEESIGEVFVTLRDAVLLVSLVVLLFLQNWRSALIPLAAVPVAVIGTFAVMAILGFSVNNLTLFGLVLAIGIVVDDAIVVVEAVEHHIENGIPPYHATVRAMSEVSGPVIAVGLVLSAVFVPCAFITGISGQFYRQFALTIAVSTLISAFNSLTLSPALTALLLRPKSELEALPRVAFPILGAVVGWQVISRGLAPWTLDSGWVTILPHLVGVWFGGLVGYWLGPRLNHLLGRFFALFNRVFHAVTVGYTTIVARLLRVSALVLVAYAGLLGLTWLGFSAAPAGFIPEQDKGYLLVNVQLPDSASLERTQSVMKQLEALARQDPATRHTVAIAGQSLLLNANAPNFGSMYVMLKDFHERTGHELTGRATADRLLHNLQEEVGEGLVGVFGAPPVEGMGTAGGFKLMIEDRGGTGPQALQAVSDSVAQAAGEHPDLQRITCAFRADTPWLYLDIDRTQARMLGVSMGELFSALQVYLGSLYINDFNRFGRTWQVNVQGDANFRRQVEGLKQLRLRGEQGQMVPLGALLRIRETSGPVMVTRYNLYPSAAVNGYPAPQVSSGQAIDIVNAIAQSQLPRDMRAEWTELALLQLQTGRTAVIAFVLAVVLVFLVLAAQYESWILPLAVILVVPMCLLCSIAGVLMAQLDVNIFTQVGFVVLVGLACKNAILIVEFAKVRAEHGVPVHQAVLAACQLRLRPIVMTSFAFIVGVVPLILASGAGAEMRHTLGTAVFAGMLGVTLFGIFLTPVFFAVVQGWKGKFLAPAGPNPPENGYNGGG
ncbi:MAG: efflux RND transporter permease subunit [Gemmataceae bacterium]|nr:efflux RND transporter permease subunit [Gemmataceae bacterium]